ncbi:DUF1127 domain-containing protein [Salipiger sp. IMCC34102]|uniref:DUF1127 domain-containing protein n=1 Tax=Salipiger sp. IMCC34102 TaxID=2510647 RepID=UPI00101C5527|nr:DUF1127 domain-containing protein [Salipiger sp. IMCC34102]RYH04387.1 DUF1127 domain-containing protein [Salipiger sp. IMCC34102]
MAIATSTSSVRTETFLGLKTQFSNYMARRAAYNRTYAELSSLTDRELSDLGLSRGMIRAVAQEAALTAV